MRAAPILVNSINEIMNKLAKVERFAAALSFIRIFVNHNENFGISPTVAHKRA